MHFGRRSEGEHSVMGSACSARGTGIVFLFWIVFSYKYWAVEDDRGQPARLNSATISTLHLPSLPPFELCAVSLLTAISSLKRFDIS